jgi:small subunit ribosomal protein S20
VRTQTLHKVATSDRVKPDYHFNISKTSPQMPVTKSAKKALSVAIRRHEENILQRTTFKQAIKGVKKAVEAGSKEVTELFSKAQSALDKAAKKNTIHPNKAARLKSRLAKKLTAEVAAPVKKTTAKKAAPKKTATKKASK